MQEYSTTEQRLLVLEARVAELERKAEAQENRDIALLARVDGFIDDLRRIERVQMRAFDELKAGQQAQAARMERLERDVEELKAGQSRLEQDVTGIKRNVEVLTETAKDHKAAIEGIASNVEAILSAVRGPKKLND